MAAPELRLEVSLGLNTFRNQMRTLVNIAQSEFTAQLNVRFNRATLAKELDGLRRAIGRSTYKVEIGGNWENLPAKVASLQKALQDLRSSEKVELKVGGIASINSKEARRIRTALYRQLTSAGGKLLVPATITAKTTKADKESLQKQIGSIVVPFSIDPSSAKDDLSQLRASAASAFTGIAVSLDFSKAKTELDSFAAELKAKLSNITVNVKANLEQQAITKGAKTSAEIDADVARGLQAISEMGAARMSSAGGGSVTEAARREQLRSAISGEGVTKLKNIAGQLGVGGAGKYRTATINDLIDKIVKEASIEAITKYLDPKAMMRNPDRSGLQKALDTFARGVFRMLGIDPESIRQKRLPPAINWQATTPPSGIPIGPSSTGRMLPGGVTPATLPGTAFVSQKRLVGDILSAGLKEAIRNAANAFVDNVRRELVAAVRSTSVVDLGNRVKAIRPGIEPKLLTPGIGRAAELYRNSDRSEFFARREAEARARSELRSADILASTRERPAAPYSTYNRPAKPREAIIPYQGPGALVRTPEPPSGPSSLLARRLPTGYLEAGMMASGLRNADRYLKQAKVPLAGAIEELGSELSEATKQVLLYGAAYKALAFFTNLPRQAFDAAKALQTFNNQLNAVTGNAQSAARASAFVSSVVDKFNIPLDSAREGFVKLYASMEPAGINPQVIEGLFVGISKASATLGLSSDQVDRITYAFSQMASKGQIMAEEVSGQLGDVIPGALSIMAKAAGLSMSDFKVAMEKGQLSGKALEQVFANLEIVLDQRFGKGAKGAATTLQGTVNAIQTAMTRLYQSFEPMIGAMAQAFGPTVISLINDSAAAVKAFSASMSGSSGSANMLSQNGKMIYGVIRQLAEIFKATKQVIEDLAPTFGFLGGAVLTTLEYLAKFINTPIGAFLANWAIQSAIAMTALQLLAKAGILNAASAMLELIRQLITGQITLSSLATTAGTAKFALMGLGATAVLAGLTMLISHLNSVYQKMLDIQSGAKDAARSIASMSATEAVITARKYESQIQLLRKFQAESKGLGGLVSATGAEVSAMAAAGGTPGVAFTGPLVNEKTGQYGPGTIDPTQVEAAIQRLSDLMAAARQQTRADILPQLQKVDLAPGKDQSAGKALEEAQKQADIRRKYESDLMKLSHEQAMALSDIEFEHWKTLQDQKFDYAAAGQNEWMQRELKFQKDLQAIEIRRMETVRRANQESQKAAVEAAAAAYVAQSGGGMAGAGRATFGATGRVFNAPGWVHGHFQNMNREALIRDTTDVVMKLLSQGVKPELGSGARFSSGMSQQQVEGLVRSGIAGHKKYGSGVGAVDIFVPEGTRVPVPLSNVAGPFGAGGIQGTLPGGTQLMHLAPGSAAGGRVGAAAGATPARVRAEMKKDSAAMLETQQAMNARERESVTIKNANAAAQREINILIKEYVASILPVEQLKLENSLIADKNALLSSGVYGEALDTEMKIGEAQKRTALGIEQASKRIAENNDLAQKGVRTKEETNRLNEIEAKRIADLKKGLEEYLPLLRQKLQLEQQSAEATLRASIQRATPLGGMGLAAGFIGQAGTSYEEAIGRGATPQAAKAFAELQNQYTLLEVRNEAIKSSILGIGDAFGTAMTTGIASLVDGTGTAKEVFSNFLKSIGQALLQAAAQMIATYIAIGIARIFAGLGGGAKPDMSVGAITERAGIGATSSLLQGFANGGVASGGFVPFKAFAGGGVVNGPTLGLVGEGKYNEAIVPLPDGRSIPVVMKGESQSSRSLLSSNGGAGNGSPVLSMNFTTTTINGVEYVSRDQLEAAMMETRKLAAREGAQRGAVLAIDKLQQSPTTRRRIGL